MMEPQLAPLRLVEMVFPQQTNHHGTLFGGIGLALMDKAASLAAGLRLRRRFVTAASDRVDFVAPVRMGQLVELTATIGRIGRRSVEVAVELVGEELLSGSRVLSTRGRFTMVANDGPAPVDAGRPPVAEDPLPTRLLEIVFPGDCDHMGRLYGGTALSWLGKAAFIAGTRAARRTLVMASSDRVDFVAPAQLGEAVDLQARVSSLGRSSLRVKVTMHSENILSGERRLCTSGEMVLVAVDGMGRPTPLQTP